MKEYFVYELANSNSMVEQQLNGLAKGGWEVVCSANHNNQNLILVRETKQRRKKK